MLSQSQPLKRRGDMMGHPRVTQNCVKRSYDFQLIMSQYVLYCLQSYNTSVEVQGRIMGLATSPAVFSPSSAVTMARANSKQVPGPRLVMSVPSATTRASL